jgi:hypothetical protein
MLRVTLIGCCFLGLAGLLSFPLPSSRADDAPPAPLSARLAKTVNFPGLDAKNTLTDALDLLGDRYGVNLEVNEAAFKEAGLDNPLEQTIERGLPKMNNARLESVLRKLLSRIPGDAAYMIRADGIEITTKQAQRVEVWGAEYDGPFLPLVHANFDKKPLSEALQELSNRTGFNIVVDARVASKAETAVTAKLANTPLDTAVRVLADMADLKPFLTDNLLYVTTKENAARLEEQERQKAATEPEDGKARRGGTAPGMRKAPAMG